MTSSTRVQQAAHLLQSWYAVAPYILERGVSAEKGIVVRHRHPGLGPRIGQQHIQGFAYAYNVGDPGQFILGPHPCGGLQLIEI